MRVLSLALVAVVALLGCATIFSGTTDDVTIRSTPSVADVTITPRGEKVPVWSGKTPSKATLAKENEYTVRVSLPGYAPAEARIDQEFNGLVLLNILCGGVIGFAIDAVSGAFWNLDRDEVSVTLVAAAGAPTGGVFPGAPTPADPAIVPAYDELPPPPPPPATPMVTPPPVAPSKSSSIAPWQHAPQLYALVVVRDSQGELRGAAVPLLKLAE